MADLRDRAHVAERDSDLAAASAVHNLAALLASDCGLPDLARQWCHRQANVYLRTHPLGAQAARHALEPLVNLARLHIRDGQGELAFHLIEALLHRCVLPHRRHHRRHRDTCPPHQLPSLSANVHPGFPSSRTVARVAGRLGAENRNRMRLPVHEAGAGMVPVGVATGSSRSSSGV